MCLGVLLRCAPSQKECVCALKTTTTTTPTHTIALAPCRADTFFCLIAARGVFYSPRGNKIIERTCVLKGNSAGIFRPETHPLRFHRVRLFVHQFGEPIWCALLYRIARTRLTSRVNHPYPPKPERTTRPNPPPPRLQAPTLACTHPEHTRWL